MYASYENIPFTRLHFLNTSVELAMLLHIFSETQDCQIFPTLVHPANKRYDGWFWMIECLRSEWRRKGGINEQGIMGAR